MTPEQKRLYNELKKDNLAWVNEQQLDQISSQQAVVKSMRLHQIACGCTKSDTGEEVRIPNNRLKELMEILEETDGKVIIWANYRPNIKEIYEAIVEVYGKNAVVHYYGDTSNEDREEAKVRMQTDPTCRFFVGNTQTGGYGITLTESNTTIYYSNNYDLEKRLQSEDRNHRIGQTKPVTYIDLMVPGTVDMKIVRALRDKINIAGAILDDGPKEWLI